MRFAFIEQHRDTWPVELQCKVLQVSRSGFYAWINRPISGRETFHAELVKTLKTVHMECRHVYGSPRMARELKARGGISACQNTVAKAMAAAGIAARRRRRFVPRTTDSRHGNPVAPNLLDRQFSAAKPDRKWVCDITYIRTRRDGWMYLAGVMDVCSRRIIGWSMAGDMKTQLVEDALKMAIQTRRPSPGLLHHSDRGVQYTSGGYRDLLEEKGVECSMSRTGDCYDNAMMESFWSTLKRELVDGEEFETHAQAKASIFEYIEVFYNRQRRHSAIGYVSPASFEAGFN